MKPFSSANVIPPSRCDHVSQVRAYRPATQSTRHNWGSTSQNPIIVEDTYNPPKLGQRSNIPSVDSVADSGSAHGLVRKKYLTMIHMSR